MFYSTVIIAATAFTGFASALNYSTSGPLTIDPSQIDANTKLSWCTGQRNACGPICGGRAAPNTCDPNTLTYNCTCSNGNMPNISDYSQTLPFFICETWISNCVDNHPNDLVGITACRSVVCGSKNASEAEATNGGSASTTSGGSAATTAASTAGGSSSVMTTTVASVATTTSGTATSTSTKTGAAMATMLAKEYGHAVLAVGALAAFGLAL